MIDLSFSIGINESRQEPSAIIEEYEPSSSSSTGANGTTMMVSFYPRYDKERKEVARRHERREKKG